MKTNPLLFVLAGAALLAGLFMLFRPAPEPAVPQQDTTTVAPPVPQAVPAAASNVVELVVQQGRLISGPATLRVNQGEKITIRISVDVAEEFHLHGYDQKVDIEPGKPAELILVADRSGRFEYELEKSKIHLGALEVQPR